MKALENMAGNGENAGTRESIILLATFNLLSANAFNLSFGIENISSP